MLDVAALVGYLLGEQAEMVTGSLFAFSQNVIGAWD